MAKVNVLHEVSSDLKMEYQSGNIDEIQINTAENGKIMAHEVVVGFVSKYFRVLIKNARTEQILQTNPVQIDFTKYPKETVATFIDQLYQVNVKQLGLNGLLQNIDILSDCGHYDHQKYPWHANMVDLQCDTLATLVDQLTKKQKIELIIGMARMPAKPVLILQNYCMSRITYEDFALATWKMLYMNDNFCTHLAMIGPRRLEEGESSCMMISHYLHKSNIPISSETVRKELESISQNVLKDSKENDLIVATPFAKVGLTDIQIGKLIITRVMKLAHVKKTNDPSQYHLVVSEPLTYGGGKIHLRCRKTSKGEDAIALIYRRDSYSQDAEIDAEFNMIVQYQNTTAHGKKETTLMNESFKGNLNAPFYGMEWCLPKYGSYHHIPTALKLPAGAEVKVVVNILKWVVQQKD